MQEWPMDGDRFITTGTVIRCRRCGAKQMSTRLSPADLTIHKRVASTDDHGTMNLWLRCLTGGNHFKELRFHL
jgi:hypothetical protein